MPPRVLTCRRPACESPAVLPRLRSVRGKRRHVRSPSWTQEAWARWAQLDGRLAHVDLGHLDQLNKKLTCARTFLDDPVPRGLGRRISNWWTGGRIERTWVWLEQAEIDIVDYSDARGTRMALEIALQRAAQELSPKDPIRLRLEALQKGVTTQAGPAAQPNNDRKKAKDDDRKKVVIQAALEASFASSNDYHRAARALRNRLVILSLIAVISAALLVVLQWRIPTAVMITPPLEGTQQVSSWQLLLIVMAFGAIGALLTTFRPVSTLGPSGTPFNFPLQQALTKVVTGTLTATVGVILVSNDNVTNGLHNFPALIATAVVFGAAQQTITTSLDKRASSLVESSPAAKRGSTSA